MTVHSFSHASDQDDDIGTITEESPDYIMSFDGEGPGVYSPPAHIAARIYKSRNYHRKSSAASSRRNSMASHQSSRSGRSAHGGPQSTHIAQHLRRASIIESRRAKAADRNAHAEKVRLRAALNKAAPRGPVDSEEKAVAAQQAREKYLAQVRANCAAEVQRSKRIAEEQREKKAAEYAKMKTDMAERHAQAERRRALLEQSQRRPRTAQSSSDETSSEKKKAYTWKPRNEAEAASIIQAAWKRRYRRRLFQDFLQLGLTVEAAQKSSFEEFGERLNREDVIQTATKLMRLFRLTHNVKDSTHELAMVKTFLSSFLILGQPGHVLNRNSEQEKHVITISQALLMRLNQALDVNPGLASEEKIALKGLSEAHDAFQAAFAAWRSHDSEFMITAMVAQFTELDAIWQNVKDDTAAEVTEDYKEGIRHNQTLIITRLKKLAGPDRAMKLVRDAIRKSRKAQAKRKNTEHNIPRIASEISNASSSSLATIDAPSSTATASATLDNRHAARERLQSTSLVPDSRVVVHELAINKQWTIDFEQREQKRDEIINKTAQQLQEGLDAELHEIWIPALAESLLQKLSTLLPPEKPTIAMVRDVLDPQMVAQQVRNGTFSYENFFNFMNSILPKLCAPVRDDEVKALAQNPSEDPVKQMARIYFIVELMVLDMLNFQLISIAPTLLKESVGYEARAFEKFLEGHFPKRTYEWWKKSQAAISEEASRRTPEPQGPTTRVKPNKIYMQGLVDLFISIDTLEESQLPETLYLDFARLHRIHTDLLRLITISSILLNAKNLLRRDTRSLWKAEAARMWEAPYSSPPSTFVSIVESRYALPPTTKSQLTAFVTRILAEARAGHANHPVMKVLLKKIKGFVLARLVAGSEQERERLSSSATEVLGSAGMVEFVGRIGDVVHEVGRVADVDREAHGVWYERIGERAEREGQD